MRLSKTHRKINKLTGEEKNMVSSAIAIAYFLAQENIKFTDGAMKRYDVISHITVAFCKKFPQNYNWETHRDSFGNDWEEELQSFTKDYLNKHTLIFHS